MLQLFRSPMGNPWRELAQLQNQFNDLFPRLSNYADVDTVPLNVYVKEDQARVIARVPGWQPEWFDLTVEGNKLHLHGATQEHEPERKFSRVINLPFRVEADNVKATYQNGYLVVDLTKNEQDRPRKIAISAA